MGYRGPKSTGKPQKDKLELADRIDRKLRDLRLHAGNEEWDPVVGMAIIGADAYKKGDDQMALVAMREVAKYVRPQLKAVEHSGEVEVNSIDAKVEAVKVLVQLGFPIPPHLADVADELGLNEVAIPSLEAKC